MTEASQQEKARTASARMGERSRRPRLRCRPSPLAALDAVPGAQGGRILALALRSGLPEDGVASGRSATSVEDRDGPGTATYR